MHATGVNVGFEEETKKRIEKAKLKRDVESGLNNLVSQEKNKAWLSMHLLLMWDPKKKQKRG